MSTDSVVRTARRLRALVIAAMAGILLLYLCARVGLDVGVLKIVLGERASAPSWAIWVADVEMALLLVALLRLTQTLSLLAAGEMFSVVVVRRFRGFAFWLMLSAIAGFFGPLLASLIGDLGAGPVRLLLDSRQLLVFGITLLLFLLARLLERARELEDEARKFV